ncbi:MAG: TRAP transporter large permease [Rhodospirillaceae bacterium]|jgi:C4-dicarboxylate transporter, DctM subunit|nr:TRAP transporter large permease [Rhodospirillaceae bacterium]MBT4589396.1 TRAP transporter large permease [Rhodospirillaceae bacterium]MBT7267312.1 TRAP transporter large permease [Rhodospirillaceae bacterium]
MEVALFGIAILLLILFMGFPLGMSLMMVGYFGFAAVHPKGFVAANSVAGQQILDLGLNFQFSVLPLFILMGVFVARAALSNDLYETSYKWLGHFRGGLAMATVAACGGFAAVSGSSAATAATMAKVAIPSMRKFGYADSLSAGTVAAGGTMGILIPPSGALIIYGLLTEEDIAKLFMAGVIPGLITIAAYIAVIRIVTSIWPEIGPPGVRTAWKERLTSLYKVWGVLFLFFLIMGGIFFGVFTSTEAGGIGAGGALIFAIMRKKMTWSIFVDSLIEAARTTAMIFTVAFGALILNQFVNISGMPEAVLSFISSLNATPLQVVLVIMCFYVILGMFIEGIAMIFLTVPIFVPVISALGFDLIWWGIVLVMVVEISLITPPIGLNVFIMKSMLPDVPLGTIFKGIAPFFAADIFRLAIVVFFPPVALWLPNLMY